MPNWAQLLQEHQAVQVSAQAAAMMAWDTIRRKYLLQLHTCTGRNIIAYFSGWLSKPNVSGTEINDEDKNGFMLAVHELDKAKGLDLILHTPGGGIAATQSIVDYLHKMFKNDIRAVVPQLAMSGGTVIACSCKEILMGEQSSLGPIDPHMRGIPAAGVVKEFKRALKEIKRDPASLALWTPIIQQYRPTFLSQCEQAIELCNAFVEKELATVMFEGDSKAKSKAKKIVRFLSDYTRNKSHDRHINISECEAQGLRIVALESNPQLQDLVLTIHHCYMHVTMNGPACKIIENHLGRTLVKNAVPRPIPPGQPSGEVRQPLLS